MNPCVGARPADSDRQVALEDDAPAAGVGADLGQLRVQVVLHEAVKRDFAAVAAAVGFDGLFVVAGVIAPAGEIGGAEFVAQGTVGGVGHEPVAVVPHEFPVIAAGGGATPLSLERAAQQTQFMRIDLLVIDFGQGVQPVAQAAVFVVLFDAGGGQPDELRVQGEDRIGVVGVGVFPCAAHRGVVDRQQLEYPLARCGGPVDQQFQVVEFADAESCFRAERKDRNRRSGSAPPAFGEAEVRRGFDDVFAFAGQVVPWAVGTFLPHDRGQGPAVGDQELVFESLPRVEPEFPLRKPAVVHRDDPLPPLQLPAAACDGQHFVGAQGGQDDAQGDVAAVFLLRPAFAAAEDATREGRGVEGRIGGHVDPAVADAEYAGRGCGGDAQDVRTPFAADAHALALDFVTVFCRLRRRGVPLYGAGPDAVVGVLQGDAPPAEAEYELFAPAGAVFDAEQECHGIGLWEVLIATFFLRNQK